MPKPIEIALLDDAHPTLTNMLQSAGMRVTFLPDINRSDFVKTIEKYTGIILRSRITIDKEIIDRATQLEFIGRVGSGMESIDTEYATSRGIACYNSPEGNRDAVAEHALAMLLHLMCHIGKAHSEVKQGQWLREENRGEELYGKTVGIIGYGNTGSAFAHRLSVLGCKVLAYDKYKTGFSDEYTTETNMDCIFQESDILSLHVPLSTETSYLVNKKYIDNFKKRFYLINTSRGPVVNTQDAANALYEGKIKGMALDVLEYEETSFEKTSNLLQHKAFGQIANRNNVILTPHIAGWTNESKVKLAQVLASKIIEHYKK